jgi:hypothetical protein
MVSKKQRIWKVVPVDYFEALSYQFMRNMEKNHKISQERQ